MFTYIGSGKLIIDGCTTYYDIPKVYYKYRPGEILYYKPKAEKGKLEKIVIKKVQPVRNGKTEGQFVFVYQDTLNSLYNEYDLIYEPEALQIIRLYIETQIWLYKAAIKRCYQW
jgi:hypothetical protein